jgi:hypothetical protein
VSIFARNKMKLVKLSMVRPTIHANGSQVLALVAAIGLILGLSSCGSGAVGAPPDTTPVASTPLAVSPAAAELFPDVPTTFTVTGGKPGYTAFSSNSVALPVTATLAGATFTVIPGPVTAETTVDITVRDTANASASAKATVKPTTLNNQITFTPFAPTATGCGTNAICSGGDAQVVVKAALNGVVLRNRPIRFDGFQGSFQFVTPGSDALVPSLIISTDDQGEATARLRVNAGVPTQVATLQTTDVTSGLARRYNFNVVQQTDGKGILSILPSSGIIIKGVKGILGQNSGQGTCGVGTAVIFYVFGGTAPYSAASPQPSVAIVSQPIAATDGTSFRSEVRDCGKIAFIVTDSAGRTIETATLEIQRGDPADTPVAASLIVRPEALELTCGNSGAISLAGSGTFTVDTVPANIGANVSLSPTFGEVPIALSPTITVKREAKGVAPADIVFNINSGSTTTKLKLTVPASCP